MPTVLAAARPIAMGIVVNWVRSCVDNRPDGVTEKIFPVRGQRNRYTFIASGDVIIFRAFRSLYLSSFEKPFQTNALLLSGKV